jgi:hypothetical protein
MFADFFEVEIIKARLKRKMTTAQIAYPRSIRGMGPAGMSR